MRKNTFRHNLSTSCVRYKKFRYKTNIHPRWVNILQYDVFGASKFDAVPGGIYSIWKNDFIKLGKFAAYWSTTYHPLLYQGATVPGYKTLIFNHDAESGRDVLIASDLAACGLSIRLCLKLNQYTVLTPNAKDLTIVRNSFTDYSGNHYDAVKLGNYIWLTTNLKTKKYTPSNFIPSTGVGTSYSWYSYYDYNQDYEDAYGLLYNAQAMLDINSNLPNEWKVPSQSDWEYLLSYISSKQWCQGVISASDLSRGLKKGRATSFFSSLLTPWEELTIDGYSDLTYTYLNTSYTNRVLNIYSTLSWNVLNRNNSTWINGLTPLQSGAGTTSVTYNIDVNESIHSRTGYLDFYINEEKIATLRINQNGEPYSLKATGPSTMLSKEASLFTVFYESTHDFVISLEDWLSASQTSFNAGTGAFIIQYSENISYSRTGSITFRIENKTVAEVLVEQKEGLIV